MQIQFKPVRTPLYALIAVLVLLVSLVVASRQVHYVQTDVIAGDTVTVSRTLYDYLYIHILGNE